MTTRRWVWLASIVTVAVAVAVAGVATKRLDNSTNSEQAPKPPRDANTLSLADIAGSNVVALTVAPPAPGRVHLHVDIVGANPADTKDIAIQASSTIGASAATHLNGCGAGCFNGATTLAGAGLWTFTIQGRTSDSPFEIHLTAPLPAVDARGSLAHALTRMNHLRSLRVHETLRSRADGPVVSTEYRFKAPNRFAYDQRGVTNASSVAIGKRRYERDNPLSAWHVEDWPDPAGFAWPANFYNALWTPATAVRMLGPATLRDIPTHVIAFTRADTDAWFRLWLGDEDGLVHRMEMRARSHIMNQDYDSFEQPISISAPKT